jgi:hypothetical protein
MQDRDRELESELRELGVLISYPPTPDVAHATRNLLDEEVNAQPRRFRMSLPALRWAAVAAAFALLVAVPTLSPGLRATVSGLFVEEDSRVAGGSAPDAGSSEKQSEANVPDSGVSNGSKVVRSPAPTPGSKGVRITLQEARARSGGTLLLPRTPELGRPDDLYALETTRKVGVMLIYREGLPALDDTGVGLILTETRGDVGTAYLAGKSPVEFRLDRVNVDGRPGYWGPAGRLPSRKDRRLPGNVLLWEQSGVALRLEADLPKERAIRIADSVR